VKKTDGKFHGLEIGGAVGEAREASLIAKETKARRGCCL